MKSYDFANIINGLYEQLVHRNKNFSRNEGIYFCCQLDCECHGYEKDGNTQHQEWRGREIKDFHIIIINPHTVFTCISDANDHIFEIPSPEKWINKSNHDSCWRDVSHKELTDLMFHCHDEAYKNCPKELRPETKSQGVSFSLRTSVCGPIFKYVKVEKVTDYEWNNYGYREKLTSIHSIDK